MGEQPRIAVVVPCFDDGATLPEVVDSARAQEPCELVIVDDGSTDEATLRVLAELEAAGARVVRQQNAGPSSARNTGVKATSARYVFAIDADDRLLPGRLTKLADELDAHRELALVWGRYRTFGEREHVRRVAARLDPWTITYFQDVPASFMVRREALVDAGGWKLAGYESWELLAALAEHGYEGRGLDTVVYEYRLHGPRKMARMLGRHDSLRGQIRELHPHLFARRAESRSHSQIPLPLKLAIPAIDALPVGGLTKHRLWGIAAHVAFRGDGSRPIATGVARARTVDPSKGGQPPSAGSAAR